MKKGKSKSLTFFLVICLVLASLITGFLFSNSKKAREGQMLGASTTKTVCEKATYLGEKYCNAKNLCVWMKAGAKANTCVSKVADLSATSRCNTLGAVCCKNATTGQGYCDSAKRVKCNPTSYTCVESSQNNLGQERGTKGTCSIKFKGATCKWTSECATEGGSTDGTLGYCKGPADWRCCKPKPATP